MFVFCVYVFVSQNVYVGARVYHREIFYFLAKEYIPLRINDGNNFIRNLLQALCCVFFSQLFNFLDVSAAWRDKVEDALSDPRAEAASTDTSDSI